MAIFDQLRLLDDHDRQLSAMIKVRSSISEQQATQNVNDWMQGKAF